MNLRRLGLGVVFLSGAIIGGLALAFVLVVFRPELLLHQARQMLPDLVRPKTTI